MTGAVLICRGDGHEQHGLLNHSLNGVLNGNGGKAGLAELLTPWRRQRS